MSDVGWMTAKFHEAKPSEITHQNMLLPIHNIVHVYIHDMDSIII